MYCPQKDWLLTKQKIGFIPITWFFCFPCFVNICIQKWYSPLLFNHILDQCPKNRSIMDHPSDTMVL